MFLLNRPKVEYKEFLPMVMANMQGDTRPALPPEAAISYIRSAAIRFAKDALVLNHMITIPTQDGMSEYPLLSEGENERIYVVYGQDAQGEWHPATWFEDDIVSVSTALADYPEGVKTKIAVVPTRRSCEVDELLFEEWHDAIIWGALAQLHRIPQRPWTSGGLVAEYTAMYQGEVGRARRLAMLGRVVGPIRVARNRRYV